jgi:hypothetical protein
MIYASAACQKCLSLARFLNCIIQLHMEEAVAYFTNKYETVCITQFLYASLLSSIFEQNKNCEM